jgi:ribosome biogenesis GTPase
VDRFEGHLSAQHHDFFSVFLPASGVFLSAALSGGLRRQLAQQGLSLVTGDRVTLDRDSDATGDAVILSLLPRRSLLSRVEAGARGRSQPLAANADLMLLCTSMNEEFNMRRIERYLAMADGAGMPAVLLLTKADLVENAEDWLAAVQSLHPPRKSIPCSAVSGLGIAEVRSFLSGGETAVLLGSSGVGKSTLINALLGDDRLRTRDISQYKDKGRHTTTHRELIPLQSGGFLIDSPGIRELKLDDSDVSAAFGDITALAVACKYRNCSHQTEPGCAVKKAVSEGALTAQRLHSYLKLIQEENRRSKSRKRG